MVTLSQTVTPGLIDFISAREPALQLTPHQALTPAASLPKREFQSSPRWDPLLNCKPDKWSWWSVGTEPKRPAALEPLGPRKFLRALRM